MKKHNIPFGANTFLALAFVSLSACSKEATEASLPGSTDGPDVQNHYTDGTYTARGEYGGLPSHIDVTVLLRNDTVATVQVQPLATDPTSLDYQQRFAQAVPQEVEGLPIDSVNVGKLAGSSGTPVGFNDAIRQIKDQARED